MTYSFNITWEATVSVDAESEDEAWSFVHDAIDSAWAKSAGHKDITLVDDSDHEEEWGLFDRDPEEEDITNLATDYGDLF